MAKAQLKIIAPVAEPQIQAPEASPAALPPASDMAAFLALGKTGSFLRAAQSLHVDQLEISKRIAALEHLLGVSLVASGSSKSLLTAAGQEALSAMEAHLAPLAKRLDALRATEPVLTLALPSGRAGATVNQMLEASLAHEFGPICTVPPWSSAALSLRRAPLGGDCEDVFLVADHWAAVAGPGWRGGVDLETRALVHAPLVASSPEEHDAWQLLLGSARPKQLLRTSREDAEALVHRGRALGVANLAFSSATQGADLRQVSRRDVWPGTGLWASLQNGARAWDRGWSLIEALKIAFARQAEARRAGEALATAPTVRQGPAGGKPLRHRRPAVRPSQPSGI